MASKIFYSGGKLDNESMGQIAEVMDNLFGNTNVKQPGTSILENFKNIMSTVDTVSQTKYEPNKVPDDLLNNIVDMIFTSKPPSHAQVSQGKHDVDLIENDNEYVVYVDVPGCKKEDISVDISNDNDLMIRSDAKDVLLKKYMSRQRKAVRETSIKLPDDIDKKNISAKYECGVIAVSIGKKNKHPSGSKIEIQ